MMGIYKITSPSGKIYIGSSKHIQKRKNDYQKYRCKAQLRIYYSLKKYGWDAHTFEVIEECSLEELRTKERYYQELYDCIGINGLNCFLVSTDEKIEVYSEETKTNKKGWKWSEEACSKRKGLNAEIPNISASKKVINISTGEIYSSIKVLADILGMKHATLRYQLRKSLDIGYKLIESQEQIKPFKKRKEIEHIPTGLIFKNARIAAEYFNLKVGSLYDCISKNHSTNEFRYVGEVFVKKEPQAKKVLHIETGQIFKSMWKADEHFGRYSGFVRDSVRRNKGIFKVIENDK